MSAVIELHEPSQHDVSALPGFARYLTIGCSGHRFAIPLDRVIGVAESTKITPLPFSLPPFEGLVVAMGQVVPQIDLASLLELPSSEGGVVVLISDLGGSVGLRVAQVHAMLQIDAEQVVLATSEEHEVAPMIAARFDDGFHAAAVLDLERLTGDASGMSVADAGAVLLATESLQRDVEEEDPSQQLAEPYLMVGISGETYAVKIDEVLELVELSTLRPVPHSPPWIAGLMDLRGEPLLALSLVVLLGHQEVEAPKFGMRISLPAGNVALVADHSFGIERYGPDQIHPMREPVGGIASYLVKPDESIVGIIHPGSLVEKIAAVLPDWIPGAGPVETIAATARPMEFRQFLTLRVGREYLAVPLDRIHRLQAGVQVTPIPERESGFYGLADVGDAVVPVIDLRQILSGDADADPHDPLPPCLLAMIEGGVAGVIVNQVLRIETIAEDQISPAEDAPMLPVSEVLHLNGQLMSVVSLDRLLPPP